jgi:hypothetical protein
MTTKELVLKDFAYEPDDARVRSCAIVMIQVTPPPAHAWH